MKTKISPVTKGLAENQYLTFVSSCKRKHVKFVLPSLLKCANSTCFCCKRKAKNRDEKNQNCVGDGVEKVQHFFLSNCKGSKLYTFNRNPQ